MLRCSICGRKFVFGGHGRTTHLMCNGARVYRCWNASTIDGPLAARKIADALFAEIEALPAFDEAFLATVTEESARADADREKRRRGLLQSAEKIASEIRNVMGFIRKGDSSPSVRNELSKLDQEQTRISAELRCHEQSQSEAVCIPALDDLKRRARQTVCELTLDSYEFGKLMRRLIPKIVVNPVRLCDGGKIVHRARFRLHLASVLPDARVGQLLERPLERLLTVDLFDPPQREVHRRRIVAERGSGVTERAAATVCGITITAAQRAAALQRRMTELGLSDPYCAVREPPVDFPMLRRHLNPRYRFEPLEGTGDV
jgi:hypothetical protein